jgi:hypothetical protein
MSVSGGQSPEAVILIFLFSRAGRVAFPTGFGTTWVLAELSSIHCQNAPPWQEFSSQAYRLRYIPAVKRIMQTATQRMKLEP